mmetsp:Transcript_41501/g.69938  ORF Transcript_41501/g.69938 Transcript_41501/m.69938 type:complete len:307 (+) Transcript_41501:834-1754(+)
MLMGLFFIVFPTRTKTTSGRPVRPSSQDFDDWHELAQNGHNDRRDEARYPQDPQSQAPSGRLVLGIAHAIRVDPEHSLGLWEARRVIDLADALLIAAFAEGKPRGGGVGHDVAPNGLLRVRIEHGSPVHLRHDLVREDDGDAKLVREPREHPQELRQRHLARGELATAAVVRPEQGRGGVHHQQRVAGLDHHRGGLDQQLHLMVRVEGAGVRDIVQDVVGVEPVPLGDGTASLGAERPLCVDVHGLALAPALRHGQLTGHAQRVAQLSLAAAELPEHFSDGSRFNASVQQLVQLLRPGGDLDHFLA